MSGSNISKIERVEAPNNRAFVVDLCLDKHTGKFFAHVGKECVEDVTKDGAIKKVQEALAKVSATEWTAVIVIEVSKQNRHDDSTYNDMPCRSEHCGFSFFRRERAQDPLKKKERIERMHTEDFERHVKEERRDVSRFEHGDSKKRRADAREAALREGRASMHDVHHVFDSRSHEVHYEIPYSPEAWAGVERIAATLRDVQSKLDAFAASATSAQLAALASGDVLKLLPPAKSAKDKS